MKTLSLRSAWRTLPLLLMALLPLQSGWALGPAPSPQPDYCELSGAVYVVQTAAFADYRVFVYDVEGLADMVIFKENAEFLAQAPGHWFFTDVQAFADFTIYLEQTESFADFGIAFTPFSTAAGCTRQ
ncbi:MAG: hypothetical protein D6722_27780 [Bacteroidetes bacterium]|nr:MAG: hypothetical protein D6722_27780 [Bacteroidota bacterium]